MNTRPPTAGGAPSEAAPDANEVKPSANGTIPLGPFDLTARVVGQATSEIWSGTHRRTGTPVAIKFVRPPATHEATFRARFGHEVRAAAGLDHPLIVRLLDHGEVDDEQAEALWITPGTPYLVMEWLDGDGLDTAPPTDWPTAYAMLAALLDALAHAHARGVVHRDVKPGNVLLTQRGPVLTDFGIALLDAPADARSDEESLIGTPPYMAPEQVRGQWRRVGPWTDLYAVGCTAFEWICGVKAFAGASVLQVLDLHLDGVRSPYRPAFDIPAGVEMWIDRLVNRDPALRFRYAADAAIALRAFAPMEPTRADWIGPASLPAEDDAGWAEGPGPDGRPPMPRSSGQRTTGPLFPLPDTGGRLFRLRRVQTVGRTPERDWMWRALRAVVDGKGLRAIALESAAGMGKTHMARWLMRRAHELGLADGLSAFHERGGGGNTGLGPMLARHVRCADDNVDARRAAFEMAFDPPMAAGLTAALDPTGRFDHPDEPVVLDSPDERYGMLAQALAALARRRPLIVLLDDLQWGEDALRFGLYLLRRRPTLPVVLLLSSRPDAIAPRTAIASLWRRVRDHERVEPIRLGPLSAADQATQIASLVKLDRDLAEKLHETTAGSPLLAEETVRLWLSSGALIHRPEGATLRGGDRTPQAEGLEAVWLSRVASALSGAEPRAAEALEIAATLGASVDRNEWASACEFAGVPLPTIGLTRMHADRLVKSAPDGRWRFVHRALAEALVGRARAGGRWRAWNRYAAMALERRKRVDPERLARHQLEARQAEQAAETLLIALDEAMNRLDQAAARRALVFRARALGELEAPIDGEAWIQTRILRARMARRFGQMDVALRWSTRAEAQARASGMAHLHAAALIELGIALRVTENDAAGWPKLEEAMTRAEDAGDPHLRARSAFAAAACLNLLGRLSQAEDTLRAGIEAAEDAGDIRTEGDCLVGLADIARRRGALDEARMFVDAAYHRYRQAGHRVGRAMVCSILGDLTRYAGDLDLAERYYRESRDLYAAADAVDLPIAETNLGIIEFARGHPESARARLLAAQARSWAGHELRILIHALLLPIVAELGDWDAWDRHRRDAEPLLEGRLAEPDVATAARDAAQRALAAGQRERALDAWTLAAVQFETLGRTDEAAQIRAEMRRHRDGAQ